MKVLKTKDLEFVLNRMSRDYNFTIEYGKIIDMGGLIGETRTVHIRIQNCLDINNSDMACEILLDVSSYYEESIKEYINMFTAGRPAVVQMVLAEKLDNLDNFKDYWGILE